MKGEITEAPWGTRISPGTVSKLNQKIYKHINVWKNRPIEGRHPYGYLYGIVLKRTWAGEIRKISKLIAISVSEDGYRQVISVQEGAEEDKAGWRSFLEQLKPRGLKGVELIISDACMGLIDSVEGYYVEIDSCLRRPICSRGESRGRGFKIGIDENAVRCKEST